VCLRVENKLKRGKPTIGEALVLHVFVAIVVRPALFLLELVDFSRGQLNFHCEELSISLLNFFFLFFVVADLNSVPCQSFFKVLVVLKGLIKGSSKDLRLNVD